MELRPVASMFRQYRTRVLAGLPGVAYSTRRIPIVPTGSEARMGLDRRQAIIRLGSAAIVLPAMLGAQPEQRPRDATRVRPAMPKIRRPVPFDTPEADRILEALQVFPADNAWNADISAWPVHPKSARIVASIGADKPLRYNPDMAFILVPSDQPRVPVRLVEGQDESDPGPFPVPDGLPIEGWPASYRSDPQLRALTLDDVQRDVKNLGGDRHAIVVDPVSRTLCEFYAMRKTPAGWEAKQSSAFDLKSNKLRPEEWTSSDAAGLPIFPAIVRHDELRRGVITHALRVTVTRTRRAYVHPATHFASRSNDPNLPRMGERLRLRRDFKTAGFSRPVRVILEALKTHGMFVADNGIDWALSVAPDERIPSLHEELRRVKGSAFEVVRAPDRPARRGQ
jgi:hypothetical protein